MSGNVNTTDNKQFVSAVLDTDVHHVRDPLNELGQTGLKQYGGYVQDEPLPSLQGLRGVKVWREMADSDAVVGSMLLIIKQQIRKIDIQVEPADLPEGHPLGSEAQQAVDWVKGCLDDMQTPMVDVKAEAATMLEYGFAPMEFVLKYRHGQEGERKSKFDDGYLGIYKVSLRAQETVDRWQIADNGDIEGFHQTPPNGTQRFLPIEKILLFRTTSIKNNPEGRSVLRNAYRPWLMKKMIERVEGIGIERDVAGLPVVRMPMSLIKAKVAGDPQATAMYNSYMQLATHVRRDTKEGVVLPSDWDEQGKGRLYEFELMASPAKRATDTNGPINRYSQEIAQSCLVDFILMGHGIRGTQSLATTKVDVFLDSIQGYMDNMADTLQRLVEVLWEVNGFPQEIMPVLKADNTRQVDPERLAQLIQSLASAGLPIFPDPITEDWVRKRVGLPEPSPETVAMRQMQMQLPLEEQAFGIEQGRAGMQMEQQRFGLDQKRHGLAVGQQEFSQDQERFNQGLKMVETGRSWQNEDQDRETESEQGQARFGMEMTERRRALMRPNQGKSQFRKRAGLTLGRVHLHARL